MSVKLLVLHPFPAGHAPAGDRQALAAKEQTPEGIEIDGKRLMDGISEVLAAFSECSVPQETSRNGFVISEVELQLGIDVRGKLGILGSGVEAGGKAAVTLKLRRDI